MILGEVEEHQCVSWLAYGPNEPVLFHIILQQNTLLSNPSYLDVTPCLGLIEYGGFSELNYCSEFNPLTPELNPSAQRCLTRFFTGYFDLEPCISLIYAWKPTNATIIHSVYWLRMVAPTCFGIILPSSESDPSAFWEMLNWGAVDRILWAGGVCLGLRSPRTTSLDITRPSTIFYRLLLNWVSLRRH
jgi:hypothetical protein